ncbi:hypothetical protein F511_18857 [Dorcoceras hygrometricum]|uniref:DNL-type domain-containing protein n=1 Tax=Dorcoceras hygrometricum TaxID=472368 RepID=A0A2Z7D7B6_9LAMI|nr:hypothetical protein F511_18857 [Dorcoceras hygrometricum]
MDTLGGCNIHGFDSSLSSKTKTHHRIVSPCFSRSFSHFHGPDFGPNSVLCTHSRLSISYRKKKELKQWFGLPMISCVIGDCSEEYPEPAQSSVSKKSQEEAVVDLKLPRRSLLASFTCNACGTRSERLINRLAYERGLVYVQCSGCSRYHKLVDNLGLVIEYNLQDESD